MGSTTRRWLQLFAICLVLHLVERGYAVCVSAWMADESAWHFFGLLLDQEFAFHPERAVAIAFHRSAVWCLRAIGVYDLDLWRWAFGIMLYAGWPLSFGLCFALVRRRDPFLLVFPILSFALGSANAGLFSASESHFMHAAFWVAALGVLVPPVGRGGRAVVLGALVCLGGSYAGAWILALALFGVAGTRWLREGKQPGYPRVVLFTLLLVIVLGLVATALKPTGAILAAVGLVHAVGGAPANVNLQLSVLAAAVLVLGLVGGPGAKRPYVTWALVGVAGCMGTYHLVVPHDFHPDVYGYFARILNTVVPLAVFGLLVADTTHGPTRATFRRLAPGIAALWVGQLGYLATASHEFDAYIGWMAAHSEGRRGVMPVPSPGFMQKVHVDPQRWGRAPNLDQFATMWIAAPAHALLYSGDTIDVVLVPVIAGRGPYLAEYQQMFAGPGQAKLARFGIRVRVDPSVVLEYP